MPTELGDTTSIPKIRTFAADLEAVRKARGDEEETEEEKKLKPKPGKEPAEKTDAAAEDAAKKPGPKKEPEEKQDTEPKKDRPAPQVHRPKPGGGNPPFHEINHHKPVKVKIDKADVEASKTDDRQSLLEDKSKTVRIGDKGKGGMDSGTVVTDTKRKRFQLIPSIFRSVTDWLEDLKNTYITKKPQKYTVSGSYRKHGVITDESVSSGKTQVDHKEAVKRIKQRRSSGEEPEDGTDDEATEKKAPLLLEAPEEEAAEPQPRTNVVAQERKSAATKRQQELEEKEAELKKREAALKAAEAEAARLRAEAVAEAEKSKEAAAAEAEQLREEAAAAVAEAEARREAAASEVSDAQMRAAAAAILAQQEAAAEAAPEEERRPLKEQLRDTNVASLLAVVGIAGLVILYVTGSSLYSVFFTPDEIAPGITVPALVAGEQVQVGLPSENLRQDILATIDGAPERVVQIDLIITAGDTPGLAPPERIAAALAWQAEPAFVTSLRQVSIGGFDRTYPFVLLKTTDYETALGGMLSWENTLSDGLSLFRGTATGTAASTDSKFNDITLGGVDARESTAAVENQVVWGFVDDTTILIAPNRFVFAELVPLINN